MRRAEVNFSFSPECRYDLDRGTVTFKVSVDGTQIGCEISKEALQARCGLSACDGSLNDETVLEEFGKRRSEIEREFADFLSRCRTLQGEDVLVRQPLGFFIRSGAPKAPPPQA